MDLEEPEKAGIGDWDGHRDTRVGRGAAQTRPLCLWSVLKLTWRSFPARISLLNPRSFPPGIVPDPRRNPSSQTQVRLWETLGQTKTLGVVIFFV